MSIKFAVSLTNFTEMPSRPVSFSKFNELRILFILRVVACSKTNLLCGSKKNLFCVIDNLMAITLG